MGAERNGSSMGIAQYDRACRVNKGGPPAVEDFEDADRVWHRGYRRAGEVRQTGTGLEVQWDGAFTADHLTADLAADLTIIFD